MIFLLGESCLVFYYDLDDMLFVISSSVGELSSSSCCSSRLLLVVLFYRGFECVSLCLNSDIQTNLDIINIIEYYLALWISYHRANEYYDSSHFSD